MKPKKRKSHAASGKAKAHLALKKINLTKCPNCKTPKLSHTVCSNCGQYKGKQIIKTKQDQKLVRETRKKEKEKKKK